MSTLAASTDSGTEARSYPVGRFTLRLEHRAFGGDGGVALRVYGPGRGRECELLRFDCFAERPHYHIGLSHPDSRILPIDAPDAFEWSVAQLRGRLAELLAAVGAEALDDSERKAFEPALDAAHALGISWRSPASS